LAETCTDTLSDGPTDNNDDNVDIESYSDVESEIAVKIKTTVHHLSSESESGSAEKQYIDD
jgi:hypothetical protein